MALRELRNSRVRMETLLDSRTMSSHDTSQRALFSLNKASAKKVVSTQIADTTQLQISQGSVIRPRNDIALGMMRSRLNATKIVRFLCKCMTLKSIPEAKKAGTEIGGSRRVSQYRRI